MSSGMGYLIRCVDFHGLTQSRQCAGETSAVVIIIITMITKCRILQVQFRRIVDIRSGFLFYEA